MTTERTTSTRISSKKSGLMMTGLMLGLGAAGAMMFSQAPSASAQLSQNGRIAELGNAPMSFADLVEQVRPAVVSIYVTGTVTSKRKTKRKKRRGQPDLPDGHPLNKFFKKFERSEGTV